MLQFHFLPTEYKKIVGDDDNGVMFTPEQYEVRFIEPSAIMLQIAFCMVYVTKAHGLSYPSFICGVKQKFTLGVLILVLLTDFATSLKQTIFSFLSFTVL